MTVDELLQNWKRWCLAIEDCYPAGYPQQCAVERIALPYRVLIDETEALDAIEADREPDARWAETCELWVQQMDPWSRGAIQTQYVYVPAELRERRNLTPDQLQSRRALRLSQHLGRPVSVDEYQRILGGAVAEIREALLACKVGSR